MADPNTTPAPAPAAPPAGGDYSATVQQLLQQIMGSGSGAVTGPPAPATPAVNTNLPFASMLGEALGGGVSPLYPMSEAQQTQAGNAALLNFGIQGLMNSSGPVRHSLGQVVASGLLGAQGSLGSVREAQAQAMQLQQKQQELQMERLKTALPLLQMQYGATIPNPLLSANTPAVPGTAGGAGKPGGGGVALTPFIAKNLPAGVSPAEDQMVRTVIGEAGGEPLTGQQGVAAVIKNRMNLGKQDAQSVIFAPNQFEPWNNPATRAKLEGLDPTSQQYQDVLNKAVRPVMSGDAQDPTGGATHFYSPTAQAALGRSTPSWAAGQQPAATIGGHQFYKLPGTQFAGPGAPPGGPAVPAAPSTAPDATTPPAATPAAPGEQTFEQFRAQNQIDPASLMPDLAQAKAAQAAAAQQLSLARAGRGGDPNKSLSDYNTATDAVNKLQQEANAKVLDAQRQLYGDTMQRQQQAKLKADELAQQAQLKQQELAQQAAEADKQRAATVQVENIKAGNTYHQQLDKESAEYAQANTIKPMSEQALKAHQMNNGLSQLLPVMQDLPTGGGLVGSILDAHPDMAPLLDQAGVITDRQADATRLVNGLVASISSQMKPTGLGALREYEWNAFKAQLPSLLSTTTGQQKAVVMLMNMNNRIQDEGNWMNNYFNRQVPDQYSQKPGATRTAHNLDLPADSKYLSPQQMMDEQLGPIVPSYNPPKGAPVTASGQAQWEQSLPPGKPYYKTYAVPDPKNPGQPKRDSAGNVVTTKSLEVRPWQ